jgi:hypothetical protein
LIRLGISWAVLLLFVVIALLTASLAVLTIGVAASLLVSFGMRISGR